MHKMCYSVTMQQADSYNLHCSFYSTLSVVKSVKLNCFTHSPHVTYVGVVVFS